MSRPPIATLTPARRRELGARLMARIRRTSSGCWEWTAGKSAAGYGIVSWCGRSMVASRLSWMYHRGPIPAWSMVCHRCDNPPCINPHHLFLGDARSNSLDAAGKGRLSALGRPRIESLTPRRCHLLAAFRRVAQRGQPTQRAVAREAGIGLAPAQRGLAILVRLGCVEAIPAPGIGYRIRRH